MRLLPREDTHAAYVPTRAIVDQQDAPREMAAGEVLPLEIPQIVEVPAKPSIRERVIAHSRETYARPRAEVERIVADQLGHAPTEETDSLEGEARRELRALGVQRETIDQLIAQHGPDPILDQCRWLPFRGTIRNPAGYIAVAIAKGFEPPAIVRQQMEGGV